MSHPKTSRSNEQALKSDFANRFLDLMSERAAQGNEASISLMRRIAMMRRVNNGADELADTIEARLAQILGRAH